MKHKIVDWIMEVLKIIIVSEYESLRIEKEFDLEGLRQKKKVMMILKEYGQIIIDDYQI